MGMYGFFLGPLFCNCTSEATHWPSAPLPQMAFFFLSLEIWALSVFGLTRVLGSPSPGSPLIFELLYSFHQVSMVEGPLRLTKLRCDTCNPAPPQLLLSKALSLSDIVLSHPWFSCSVGLTIVYCPLAC